MAMHMKKQAFRAIIGKSAAILGVVLLCTVIAFFGAVAVVCYGPSEQARGLFVNTVMETSAAKFLAQMYLSDEQIAQIIKQHAVIEADMETDDTVLPPPQADPQTPELVIEDVVGATFKGKMMIVKEPKRLFVGTLPQYDGRDGYTLDDMVKKHKAVAGINAGGFEDKKGLGNGGTPIGYIIHNGELVFGSRGTTGTVAGFDAQGKLIVGNMSAARALEKGITEGVTFGPVLVANGEPAPVAGSGGGLNPRTAIGQRADGAVLLLVVDGRQSHSIGATYKDCRDVMLAYGAVNAANLDGGSSTLMIHNGEHVNFCAGLYGSRLLPSAFLVREEAAE